MKSLQSFFFFCYCFVILLLSIFAIILFNVRIVNLLHFFRKKIGNRGIMLYNQS